MEDYVTFEQACQLYELGFDWACNHYYDTQTEKFLPVDWSYNYDGDIDADDFYDGNPPKGIITYRISAPTIHQAQKWLRQVKETEIVVNRIDEGVYDFNIYGQIIDLSTIKIFETYEETLSAGIDKAIDLLNRK